MVSTLMTLEATGMTRSPVQGSAGRVEVHLSGLDLHRPGVDLTGEAPRSQQRTPPSPEMT